MKKLLLPLFVVVCLVGDTSTRAVTTTFNTTSWLGNISTRGLVQTGNNVMIGGFIIDGTTPKTVIVRAIGPELTPPPYNIPNALANPNLQLFNGTGTLIAQNDNWQTTEIGGIITSSQVSAIQNSGHAPSQPSESAIIVTLPPGAYTAIVSGVNNTTGVALVEVYDLQPFFIEELSHVISASQGGTITLPNGSSVSIPPGVLPSDGLVTLTLSSSMANQPPNQFIVGVGPALSISFDPTNTSGATASSAVAPSTKSTALSASSTPSPTIDFVLNFSGSTASGFHGAAPIGEYTLLQVNGSVDNWFGPPGQIDLVNQKTTFTLDPTVFSNAYASNITNFRFTFGQGNINPNLAMRALSPPGLKYWNPQTSSWQLSPLPGWDPTAKTLCLVHGVNSSVEGAFGKDVSILPTAVGCNDGKYAVQKIMNAGNYKQVIGFDYDWTQSLLTSGAELASDIFQIGLKDVDLEGHSEGGAVVLSAGSLITSVADPTQPTIVSHIVTLGGAGMGTPVATSQSALVTYFLMNPAVQPVVVFGGQAFVFLQLLTAPVIADLQPGSAALQTIAKDYDLNSERACTTILPVAGTVPMVGTEIFGPLLFQSEPFDGLIGEFEALLQGWPSLTANVKQVGPFPANHVQLECDNDIVNKVGMQVLIPVHYSGDFSGSVVDQGASGCPGTATITGNADMCVTPNADGTYFYSGTINLTQSNGICDSFSGSYPFSGTVSTLNGGSTTFSWGIPSSTATGTFNGKTFSGSWSFNTNGGPDVGNGTFKLTSP